MKKARNNNGTSTIATTNCWRKDFSRKQAAIRTPKFSGYDSFKQIRMEDDFPAKTVQFLEFLGHKVKKYSYPDLYFGGPNAIARGADGILTGVGSIRRHGGAAAPDNQDK